MAQSCPDARRRSQALHAVRWEAAKCITMCQNSRPRFSLRSGRVPFPHRDGRPRWHAYGVCGGRDAGGLPAVRGGHAHPRPGVPLLGDCAGGVGWYVHNLAAGRRPLMRLPARAGWAAAASCSGEKNIPASQPRAPPPHHLAGNLAASKGVMPREAVTRLADPSTWPSPAPRLLRLPAGERGQRAGRGAHWPLLRWPTLAHVLHSHASDPRRSSGGGGVLPAQRAGLLRAPALWGVP